MTYRYLNLRFNEQSKKDDNTHRVRFESFAPALGAAKPGHYSLLGINDKGLKVAFYVSKKVLDALTPGKTYDFRLSANEQTQPLTASDARREYGVCEAVPQMAAAFR